MGPIKWNIIQFTNLIYIYGISAPAAEVSN